MARKRILIVDDDEPTLRLMEELLSSDGYAVFPAASAEDAVRLSERYGGRIDLLIADLVLSPVSRGLKLAWELTERYPDLRVLLISAHASACEEFAKLVDAPRAAFLEKPLDPDEFVEKVRTVLQ